MGRMAKATADVLGLESIIPSFAGSMRLTRLLWTMHIGAPAVLRWGAGFCPQATVQSQR